MRGFFIVWGLVGALGLVLPGPGEAVKLNSNGGYEVVVAIDESEPFSGSNYIDNIKTGFSRLSERLFKSTNETFFIQKLTVKIPSSWNLEDTLFSSEPTLDADVRISSKNLYPFVANPNPCGVAGDFIGLPQSFFDTANSGIYGDSAKALLVEWARFRWGVWEEHGHPGDRLFPYFYKPETRQDGEPAWKVTGCSNRQINGTYQAADGSVCDPNGEEPLNAKCRFVPDPTTNNEVTSSLMHFHWLESVNNFCDEKTHNRDVPNRQNYFCNYKSVMETIKSSEDFQLVTEPLGYVPILKTEIQRISPGPRLYILLDKGHFNVDDVTAILSVVQPAVATLVAEKLNKATVAAVGSFPSSETDQGLNQLLSWRPIQGHENEFIDAIIPTVTNGPAKRDFSLAIKQASQVIKNADPINGGVILLVKTGLPTDFLTTNYEKEVEASLQAANIRLFAIEVNGFPETAQNLRSLASATSGASAAISRPVISDEVKQVFESVTSLLADETENTETNGPRIIFDETVESGAHVSVPVIRGTETLTLSLVHKEANTNASAGVDTSNSVTFSPATIEWGDQDDNTASARRFSSSGQLTFLPSTSAKAAIFVFTSATNTSGRLIVTATSATEWPEDYDVRISTTARNGVLDYSQTGDSLTPFVISAHVTQGQKPVSKVSVEAIVTLASAPGSPATTIKLKDDGLGSPDVGQNDGVYSAVFIPSDGEYSISVVVRFTGEGSTGEASFEGQGVSSRLLPVDQSEGFGCGAGGCESVVPSDAFTKTINLGYSIQVKNRNSFANDGKPAAVRDLTLADVANVSDIVLMFTAPQVLGKEGSPEVYALYASTTKDLLIDLDLSKPLPVGVENPTNYTLPPETAPGTGIYLRFSPTRDGLLYLTVVGWNGKIFSPISNIQSKDVLAAPEETTTEDLTTVEDSTSTENSLVTEDSTVTDNSGVTDESTVTDENSPATEDSNSTPTDVSSNTEEPSEGPTGSTEEVPVPSTSENPDDGDDSKPWIQTTGGIVTIVVIVLVVVAAAGGGYYIRRRRRTGSLTRLNP